MDSSVLFLGTFENTLVILGSDHGTRFGRFRNTGQGRIEERLPVQLLVIPKWFKKEYKSVYETLKVLPALYAVSELIHVCMYYYYDPQAQPSKYILFVCTINYNPRA